MIKMTGETVERTLQCIINKYNEAVSFRGDGKSISHAMDICALYDAILCVRQSHAMDDFEFRDTGVMDQLKAIAARRMLLPSKELFYAMYEAYMLGAIDYRKQLAIAIDKAVNKEKYDICDTESEVK